MTRSSLPHQGRANSCFRWIRALCAGFALALVALAAPRPAAAQLQLKGFLLNHFTPSTPGSDWFVMESLDLRGTTVVPNPRGSRELEAGDGDTKLGRQPEQRGAERHGDAAHGEPPAAKHACIFWSAAKRSSDLKNRLPRD